MFQGHGAKVKKSYKWSSQKSTSSCMTTLGDSALDDTVKLGLKC